MMPMVQWRGTFLCLVALAIAPQTTFAQQSARPQVHGRVTDHVVVISIDGLRPDAIPKFKAPTLQRLMEEGRYSLSAQTISLSLTLPAHVAMLSGVDADQHGITWNTDETRDEGYVRVPTIFSLARAAGFSTAAFFSKTKFHHLEVPKTLDYAWSPYGTVNAFYPPARTADRVERYLRRASPNLLFVHLAEPDFSGHRSGWMSSVYGRGVRAADVAVERILKRADAQFGRGAYTVIVTADHGGEGKTHIGADATNRTIPWIAWGAGVQRGDTLSDILTMDTGATVLWLLGVAVPDNWVGRPVMRAFAPAVSTGR